MTDSEINVKSKTSGRSENINNKGSYMSYWQKKYNAKFLSELCEDYQTNYKSLLKE